MSEGEFSANAVQLAKIKLINDELERLHKSYLETLKSEELHSPQFRDKAKEILKQIARLMERVKG